MSHNCPGMGFWHYNRPWDPTRILARTFAKARDMKRAHETLTWGRRGVSQAHTSVSHRSTSTTLTLPHHVDSFVTREPDLRHLLRPVPKGAPSRRAIDFTVAASMARVGKTGITIRITYRQLPHSPRGQPCRHCTRIPGQPPLPAIDARPKRSTF